MAVRAAACAVSLWQRIASRCGAGCTGFSSTEDSCEGQVPSGFRLPRTRQLCMTPTKELKQLPKRSACAASVDPSWVGLTRAGQAVARLGLQIRQRLREITGTDSDDHRDGETLRWAALSGAREPRLKTPRPRQGAAAAMHSACVRLRMLCAPRGSRLLETRLGSMLRNRSVGQTFPSAPAADAAPLRPRELGIARWRNGSLLRTGRPAPLVSSNILW